MNDNIKMQHFLYALMLLGLLITPVVNADDTLSGKPYTKSIDLDTSLPDDLHDDLPELGDVSETVLSAQDEQRIAEQILAEVAVSDEVLQDVEIVDYLQSLGARLAAASDDKQQNFYFFVVKDPSINAFAMPGGVIGVHTGLFLASNTESELAGVLGHEIGHVTQHHLARMLAKQKTDTFKNIAGIALALLVARSNPQLASGALSASSAAGIQRQLDYTRAHEREADRVGLSILDNAGFDPRGMPAFFTTLQRGSRFVDGSAPSFLRTHPLTTERITDVENRVASMPYKQIASSLDYYFVKAKLRASSGLAQAAIDQFKNNIAAGRYANETSEHYGLALAMLRKSDVGDATEQIKWLDAHGAKSVFVENLKARVEVAKNNPQNAAKQYKEALQRYPDNRALIYGYAEHFLAIKDAKATITLVKEKQHLYPRDSYFYELLAKAYYLEQKDLLRYQAQGEAYYRQYNLDKAVEQMEFATKAKDGTFYEKSIVEARLKELQRMQSYRIKG
ncbi:MAG: M48 family metalloprotease [Methylophilaceae bacterium]